MVFFTASMSIFVLLNLLLAATSSIASAMLIPTTSSSPSEAQSRMGYRGYVGEFSPFLDVQCATEGMPCGLQACCDGLACLDGQYGEKRLRKDFPPSGMLKLILGTLGLAVTTSLVWRRRFRRVVSLPPGPPKLPIFDNLFNMPVGLDWEAFAEMAKQYDSDIIHLSAFGTSIVVLNSYEAAKEILDQRSGIYSDRPRSVMRNDLSGCDTIFVFLPYGSLWRRSRKLFTKHFNEFRTNPVNQPREIYYTRQFLRQLLENPEDFTRLTYLLFGSISISMTYGVKPVENNDPFIALAKEGEYGLLKACDGSYLVDFLPILKHVPSWVPGANFQRVASTCLSKVMEVRSTLAQAGKEAMERPDNSPSFLSEALRDLEDGKDFDEEVAKDVASTVYYAAIDTINSTTASFFLAMTCYPEVQWCAQEELDRVLHGRLPDHDDLDQLPYITALVLELLRWNPAVPLGVPHATSVEDIYKGYYIPKDTLVLANQWAMLHNPIDYPDPFEFKPERFLKDGQIDTSVRDPRDIAFGFGRRICPGRHIAISMVKMVVASVLTTFDIKKKVGPDGLEIEPTREYVKSLTQKPKEFPCDIKVRSHSAELLINNAWDAAAEGETLS